MDNDDLLKQSNIQEIARKGDEIYQRIKIKHEPQDSGKFLAIDTDTEKTFIGNSSADALEKARKDTPGKVFYVVKIGYDVAETIAHSLSTAPDL